MCNDSASGFTAIRVIIHEVKKGKFQEYEGGGTLQPGKRNVCSEETRFAISTEQIRPRANQSLSAINEGSSGQPCSRSRETCPVPPA